MVAYGNQNQLQTSLAPFGDLLKTLMFLSNLNGFNSSPSLPIQGFAQRKGSPKLWKEKGSKWFYHFLSLFMFFFFFFLCITYVFCFLFWVSLVLLLCFALLNMFFLFIFSFVYFVFHIKIKKNWKIKKNTKIVCVLCTLVLMYLGWPLKQSFLNFVSVVA